MIGPGIEPEGLQPLCHGQSASVSCGAGRNSVNLMSRLPCSAPIPGAYPPRPKGTPMTDGNTQSFQQTGRNTLSRRPQRGHYDKDTVYGVLDAALIAHIGYTVDGQVFVTPTSFWREGDTLYWHGSRAGRGIIE